MLSVQSLYENQIIGESALLRKIGMGLAGIAGITGMATVAGSIQASRHKMYQNLVDKLNNQSMSKNPSVILGFLSGVVPLVGVYFFINKQKQMEELKKQIKNKLNDTEVKQLNDLYNKYISSTITNKGLKLMTELEFKLQKKFTPDEIDMMSNVLNEK